jgi:hypothetical protein
MRTIGQGSAGDHRRPQWLSELGRESSNARPRRRVEHERLLTAQQLGGVHRWLSAWLGQPLDVLERVPIQAIWIVESLPERVEPRRPFLIGHLRQLSDCRQACRRTLHAFEGIDRSGRQQYAGVASAAIEADQAPASTDRPPIAEARRRVRFGDKRAPGAKTRRALSPRRPAMLPRAAPVDGASLGRSGPSRSYPAGPMPLWPARAVWLV